MYFFLKQTDKKQARALPHLLRIHFKLRIMPIQTPIRGLRSFCIAAKCLSFKHAAEQLYLTPSAISHQIKQLEAQLGFELFKRQTRAIELTNAGKQFHLAVQPILTELESTISSFTNNKPNQTITIALPEFFASELFVPKLGNWTEQHPNINLQLETIKAADISVSHADLTIALSKGIPNDGLAKELFPLRYAPACNKKLYRQWVNRGFDALKHVPLILHQARPWSWHQWADKLDISDFDPKQIIQFDTMFGVARAAQQGMGIALIPLPISKAWFREQLLIKLFDQELITNDKYYLIQHKATASDESLALFSQWITDTFTI